MPAPAEIVKLVQLFERNYDQYRSPAFSETAARLQFIDPFFAALGWDMYNTQEFAEPVKEVIHEDKVKVGAATKAPDYSFRRGRERMFFVEAKKPAVDIQHDVEPAYQLRRYAWSAHLPLSILTDFEQFSVYDCRSKPDRADKASTGRILLLGYKEYVTRWDEIAGVFGKTAVWQGALDKFAEAKAGKRGTAEVDDEFLAEIERWRELLARNLALRNPTLRGRDLNWAVQQTIDRIVFLRICEARDLETFEQLHALLNGGHTYERLQELFRRADMRYNSGLFHFEVERDRAEAPDTLTPGLAIDDKVLKDIIEHLYYPQSPYEFSVLPADILGHVYERFLGKVIRLTPGRQVKIEEKPEVRKAGGVFYTPTYIVDYIVRQTVGPLLAGKTPAQVGGGRGGVTPPLRIADIACGSGSFLLGAYQYLLDWHLAEYLKDPDRWLKSRQPALERASNANGVTAGGGSYRLTIAERKRILMNNIYGVDIDPQAVEVTKLSLLLKVLEGEGVAAQMSLGLERVLPDLGRNIKCGNSLIGPDFYDGKLAPPDEETVGRVNAFDWAAEFPEVFPHPPAPSPELRLRRGGGGAGGEAGFDAVIGNPPYIRIQALQEWAPLEVEHYKRAYRAASKGNYDIYVVFVEKGLRLLNEHGSLGFILPHKFFNAQYGEPLRKLLSEGQHLSKVVHFGDQQVFEGATTYTCLLFLERGGRKEFQFVRAHDLAAWRTGAAQVEILLASQELTPSEWRFVAAPGMGGSKHIKTIPLQEYAHVFQGLATSADSVYVLEPVDCGGDVWSLRSKELGGEVVQIEKELLHPLLKGAEITRYAKPSYQQVVIFPYIVKEEKASVLTENELRRRYPHAYRYFVRTRGKLLGRSKVDQVTFWHFPYPKNLTLYSQPKILVQVLSTKATFTFDHLGEYYFLGGGTAGGNAVRLSGDASTGYLYLLGILNSSVCTAHVRRVGSAFRGGYFAFGKASIGTLPIRTIDFTDPADVARHDRMVALVTQMLDLHARLAAEGVPHEVAALRRRIEMTDRQIDSLVYELYGLTPEEIGVVEEA